MPPSLASGRTAISGHRAITEACHKHGTVVLVQIHHGGYNTHPECGLRPL